MKGLHSLWTGTPGFRLTYGDAIIYSAAVAFTNRAFQRTELVTDCKGLRIADRLGWRFRHCTTELEGICPEYARHVWALGKINAQSVQTEPFMHIDLDFIWKDPPPRRVLEAQVVVQSKDEPEGYFAPEREAIIKELGLPRGVVAFNAGIVGWTDLALCREYCELATKAALDAAKLFPDGRDCSLIAEQYVLGLVLRERGVRAEELIPIASIALPGDYRDVQFIHAWAETKRNPSVLFKVEARFRQEFPAEFTEAEHGYKALKKAGLAE